MRIQGVRRTARGPVYPAGGAFRRVCPSRARRYPDVEFFADAKSAQLAHGMSSRYTDDSLRGIWGDVVFLSQTEYLVCTFSSQVRAAPLAGMAVVVFLTGEPRRCHRAPAPGVPSGV